MILPTITDDALAQLPGVRHAFFTRQGGVSRGIHASLNCGLGSKDDPAHVAENRARAAAALDREPDRLITLYQVHSPTAVAVERPWAPDARPQADGMATREPGLVLGILTADCAPVLFADAEAGVIGAAHAGWKGAFGGVLEATVAAMERLGAQRRRIVAAIGPCIHQPSYEVGPEFRDRLEAEDARNAAFFAPSDRPDHALFDLPGYVSGRLAACGLAAVAESRHDTAADEERFFSYRRATLRGEPDYGRGLSAIVLGG